MVTKPSEKSQKRLSRTSLEALSEMSQEQRDSMPKIIKKQTFGARRSKSTPYDNISPLSNTSMLAAPKNPYDKRSKKKVKKKDRRK
jgi:hypothetical protein